MCAAEELKSHGNVAFVEKDYARAIELYSLAIALDNRNHVRAPVTIAPRPRAGPLALSVACCACNACL